MKKAELMEFGIPEEKIRAFHTVYWADVKAAAVRMVKDGQNGEEAPSPAAIREAIFAMLRLIVDPARLCVILSSVNRQYQIQQNEANNTQGNAQKQPVNGQEGASQ